MMSITKSLFTLLPTVLLAGCLVDDDPAPCNDHLPAIRLGGEWVKRGGGTNVALTSVVWTGSRFVAAGEFDSVLVSDDGVSWEKRPLPASLNDLAWSGSARCPSPSSSLLVGVGDSGIVVTSPDGLDWTARGSGTSNSLHAVGWTGDGFFAVGSAGTILASSDGVEWSLRESGATAVLRDIAWNDSLVVAVGDTILTSPDGAVWTGRETADSGDDKGLKWVSWTGTEFKAWNPWGELFGGYALSSADGISWGSRVPDGSGKLHLVGEQSVSGSGYTDVATEASLTVFPPVGDAPVTQGLGEDFVPLDVAWDGSRLVVVGLDGTIMTLP